VAKLVLVVVLVALISIIGSAGNKAKKLGDAALLIKVQPRGKLALLTGITVVILAVYIFH
jgi:hypothetical protein